MRYFEKISENEFIKDCDNHIDYNNYNLPCRKTMNSAGYDFELIQDVEIKPNEVKIIPTGIKACMNSGEVLMLFVRSSIGFKHNIRLTNQTGVIDMDYYNNINNEGHIYFSIQNHSNEIKTFKKGDPIIQGIFINYLVTDNEKNNNVKRIGGIGSTNKKEEI